MKSLQITVVTTYRIGGVIQAFTHQRHVHYEYSAGRQCGCVDSFFQIFATIQPALIWDKINLNIVLLKRNELYQSLNTSSYLSDDDLPRCIFFEGT